MERNSRHLYDIAKILSEVKLSNDLKTLIHEIREQRKCSKNNPSAKKEDNITEMLYQIIESKYFEFDYKKVTSKLLWEEYKYETAIDDGILIIAKSNLF